MLVKLLRNKREDYVVRCAAAESLGKIGGDVAAEVLSRTLSDEDELLRGYAAEVLVKVRTSSNEVVPLLKGALKITKDEYIRDKILRSIKAVEVKN